MTTNSIQYLQSIDAWPVKEGELEAFVELMWKEEKSDQRASIDYFLHTTEPSPECVALLIESDLVRHSIDLQHSIGKYVRERAYREAEKDSEKESPWLELLVGLQMLQLIP